MRFLIWISIFAIGWLLLPRDSSAQTVELDRSVRVFRASEDPRYTNFREPVVVQTRTGKLVVVVQAGHRLAWPERSGQDLVVRISEDHGASWGQVVVAAEHGDFSCQCHGLVYDAEVDRLLLLYTVYNWSYKEVGDRRGARATAALFEKLSAAGDPMVSSFVVHSDDGGERWSEPREITSMVGTQAHFGASEGRQLSKGKHRGRLLVAGSRMDLDPKGVITHKHIGIWYSDDHGETWQRSAVPIDPRINTPRNVSSEARVTELGDGSLLYNQRTRSTGRLLSWSEDGGTTWKPTRRAPELEATQCNGSLITLRDSDGELTDTVVFSIPSPGGRSDGLLYVSKDGGRTWPSVKKSISGNFAYSALVQIDYQVGGLFYETNHYKDIVFVPVGLADLIE